MLKKVQKSLEKQKISEKSFDDFRNVINDEFESKTLLFKNRTTQGMCWLSDESNLANQYIRTETWIFGFKLKDDLKIIDHIVLDQEDDKKDGKIGFKK